MPMQYRKDPMAGAAEIITAIEETAKSGALPTTVATVGKVLCSPNVPNVIPEKVQFVVDIRDVEPEGIESVTHAVMQKLEQVASQRSLRYTVKNMSSISPTTCSEKVVDALERSAKNRGIPYKRMISGALHDTAVLAGITDAGMLFVPSIHGRSHCPEEYTDIDDIARGCDVLLGALKELSKL
jgi:hydantoinase/carbamoylase family amidase